MTAMTSKPRTKKKEVPAAFRHYNETKYQRTVRLTRQAIAKLQADQQKVTLAAIAAATRTVDETGKGITTTTILRNSEAAALFRQHSPAYQARQQAKSAASQPEVKEQIPVAYRGLSSTDLIQKIEKLKKQVANLKTQRNKLKVERDEAYRLRDEALQQNTQQLARLTQLMNQTGETND
jgi:hypothetical protein